MSLGLGLSLTSRTVGKQGGAIPGINVPNIPVGARVVSGGAFRGIPAGNAGTGAGTTTNPFLTIAEALVGITDGTTIVANGDPASPTDYRAATIHTFAKGITVTSIWFARSAVEDHGATLSATTTTARVISVAPVLGQNVTLENINVAGRELNTICIEPSTSPTTLYGLILHNVHVLGASLYGIGSAAAGLRCLVTIINPTFRLTSARSCLYLQQVLAGGVIARGGSYAVSAQKATGFGAAIHVNATASGASFDVQNITANIVVDAAATGSGSHGVLWNYNCKTSTILNNVLNNNSAATVHNATLIYIAPNEGTTPLDTGNFLVAGNTGLLDSVGGGIAVQIGQDGTPTNVDQQNLLNGGFVINNRMTGSDATKTGGAHAYYSSQGANTFIGFNYGTNFGLGCGDQKGNGATWACNVIYKCDSRYLISKGSVSVTWALNTCIGDNLNRGKMFSLIANVNDDASVSNCLNVREIGNNYYGDNEGNTNFTYIDAGQDTGYISDNNNHYTTGTLYSGSWSYLGTTYATLSAFVTAAAGKVTNARSIDPQFRDLAGGNYDLLPTSGLGALVPAVAGVTLDYLGRTRSDPSAIGAFERQVA